MYKKYYVVLYYVEMCLRGTAMAGVASCSNFALRPSRPMDLGVSSYRREFLTKCLGLKISHFDGVFLIPRIIIYWASTCLLL